MYRASPVSRRQTATKARITKGSPRLRSLISAPPQPEVCRLLCNYRSLIRSPCKRAYADLEVRMASENRSIAKCDVQQ
jgi:hypothetical protein